MGREPFGIMLRTFSVLSCFFVIGWAGTTTANSVMTFPCANRPINEAALCATVKRVTKEELLKASESPCSIPFGQYACAQKDALQVLSDDFLMSLYPCLSSQAVSAMDSTYSILFFSKLDHQVLMAASEKFNKRFSGMPLSEEWNAILFNGIWERLLQRPDANRPPVLAQWFRGYLRPFVVNPQVFACLRDRKTSCDTFHKIVTALGATYSSFAAEEQKNIYHGMKSFLKQDGSMPRCCQEGLQDQSSTAWFVDNLGSFMEHASVGDLLTFADEPMLQKFARDPSNLHMVSNLTLLWETAVYYTSLLTSASDFNLASLPDNLVCYLGPSAVSHLNRNEALNLAVRINKNCLTCPACLTTCPKRDSSCRKSELLQLSAALVKKIEKFHPEILNSLGQVAVGLSVLQIKNNIHDNDLVASLPALSDVCGWTAEQARAILGKLFNSGYQIQDGRSLAALGSLVIGFNSSSLQNVSPQTVLDAVKVPHFACQLDTVPDPVKTAFVEKLVAAVKGDFNNLVKYIPCGLAPHVPKSLLVPGSEFSIEDLNSKPWTAEQAAMFFDDVNKRVTDVNSLSASVLHGFTCAAAKNMDTERLQRLAKAMKRKDVQLSEEQLNCLTKLVMTHGIPNDFNEYPNELLLFLSPSQFASIGSCKEYFAHIGKSNIDILQKGSPQRMQLLLEALACLHISGVHVSKENADILGSLVCDLDAKYIAASGENLLKHLNRCRSFTPDQIQAIQVLLSSGKTSHGPPSKWTSSILEKLSGVFHVFDHSILKKIPVSVLYPWQKCFRHTLHLPREPLSSVAKNLQSSRMKRAAECPPDKTVTDEVVKDELMPIYYSPEELRACLKGPILADNLNILLEYPFAEEHLEAIKANLNEMYPTGYPSAVISKLGEFPDFITTEDIKKWKINSVDTLQSLLDINPPDDRTKASAIIKSYTDSGSPLNAEALNAIGSRYICLLTEDQLNKIDENAIKTANTLDITNCPQRTKDILYAKAKRAYSDQHNEFPAYYNLIKPYLGGAPADDLRALSKNNVNMDIETFKRLNKDSVLALTPSSVSGLLGSNLPALKAEQNNSPIKEWIRKQKQSDLDKLGIGLTGGLPEGYINIAPRLNGNPGTSAAPLATSIHALHIFPALLLTLLLTSLLS